MYEQVDRLSLGLLNSGGGRWGVGLSVFVALTAALLAGVLAMGPYPITLFPTDVGYALAQGEYLARGYRPYVDYFSFHGPFPFLFTAIGIEVHGISLEAVVLSQVLGAGLIGLLMWKVACGRLHAFWVVTLAICVELLLVSYTPLGRRTWREFSSAMWYNASSFSLMAIVFLYVLLPSRSPSRWSRWLDSAIVAFCMMGLFHSKMSFFGPVAIVFVIGAVLWPPNAAMRAQGVATLALAALLIIGLSWALGGSTPGYLAFLKTVSMRVHPVAFALRFVQYTRTISLFLVGALLAWAIAHESQLVRRMSREWFLAFLMLGATLVITGTCKQDQESLPLIGIVPLGLGTALAGYAAKSSRSINPRLAAPLLLVSLILITIDAKNSALSLVMARVPVKTFDPLVERLPHADSLAANVALSARVDPALFSLMPRDWVEYTFAALALLKEGGATPGEVLFVSTDANGITMFTDLKPPHGETPWVAFAFAANPTDVAPTVDNFLADVQWILRDRNAPTCWENVKHFRGPFVDDNFSEVARNETWILYKRNDASAPASPSASAAPRRFAALTPPLAN